MTNSSAAELPYGRKEKKKGEGNALQTYHTATGAGVTLRVDLFFKTIKKVDLRPPSIEK